MLLVFDCSEMLLGRSYGVVVFEIHPVKTHSFVVFQICIGMCDVFMFHIIKKRLNGCAFPRPLTVPEMRGAWCTSISASISENRREFGDVCCVVLSGAILAARMMLWYKRSRLGSSTTFPPQNREFRSS